MKRAHSYKSLSERFKSSFWAVGDQAVVSFGNFMTQILLARDLPPAQYSLYTLIFAVLLVVFTSHGSVVAYPLTVLGASSNEHDMRSLCTGSLALSILLALPFAALAFGLSVVTSIGNLGWFALSALLFWQLQETLRRGLMARLRHRDAIWGDALSYLGQIVLLRIIAHAGHLSLPAVLLTLAATSAAGALLQAAQLGLAIVSARHVFELARKYWRLGRWALLNSLSDTGSRQAFPWALALLVGSQQVASYQAVLNLLGVSHPVLYGATNVIVPAAAEANRRGGSLAAFRNSLGYGALIILALLPYFAALLCFPEKALAILYGPFSAYLSLAFDVRLAVAAYVFGISGAVLTGYLLGVGRSKHAFAANIGAICVSAFPTLLLIDRVGAVGAIGGLLLWLFTRAALNVFLAHRVIRGERSGLLLAVQFAVAEAGEGPVPSRVTK